MFLDARDLGDQTLRCDICIVGAGAAGIAMAMELARTNLEVILLEAGSFEFDADSQAIYEGESIGHDFPPLDAVRLRFFGGSTNHWQGMSRPLDPLDFTRRDHVPHSGWPIGYEDLEDYYKRAFAYCELGSGRFDLEALESHMGQPFPWKLLSGAFRHSPPTRFGEAYRDEIKSAENVRVLLHANVTAIELEELARAVHHLAIATLEGQTLRVEGSAYVLACGGIENARLLLNSDSIMTPGVGNAQDLVGRFFMDHPIASDTAEVRFIKSDERIYFYGSHRDEQDIHLRGFAGLPPEMQAEQKTLNCGFMFQRFNFTQASEGIQSLKSLMREFPDDLPQHVGNILGDLDDIVDAVYRKAVYSIPTHYRTTFWMENVPSPDSRLLLTGERDALGLRRVALNWKIDEDHLHTYRAAHEALAMELGRLDLARVKMLKPGQSVEELEFRSSDHHMGTTRMHDDPKAGVVDANCRVHGVENLFIAGSSVFPTAGHTNPTTTLVALALRLSDHLQTTLDSISS